MLLQRREFLKAMVASVVAAGAPLPVGCVKEMFTWRHVADGDFFIVLRKDQFRYFHYIVSGTHLAMSGKSIGEYMKTEKFLPLGMED